MCGFSGFAAHLLSPGRYRLLRAGCMRRRITQGMCRSRKPSKWLCQGCRWPQLPS
ncbi:uncharacterized protein P174DRAFT_278855 [Aspergillus novofumigatus IBT 16806]|uniref:Uncharacterized protein n=1 Tax=Aspergillus novofumigatus (strain IBT 16806) TaxID=1392255 RepID=A0A2I1BZZ3_ASPN1|nr:uncharacterized protein P174DRAFT_278855 [Aspergillus novofumigatus IBT 16806]PKX90948.1 hypothetical protein P174DRAFT_278855 [Aspergillus novofumigatus IBT 16806]